MVNPYEYLYIYYLEGVPDDRALREIRENPAFVGNWEEAGSSFLFFTWPDNDQVRALVRNVPHLEWIDRYEMTSEEWHGERIESYNVGRLVISPPWKIPYIRDPDTVHLLLDPGVVFGTGRHPTTLDCLEKMTRLIPAHAVETVLDVGTGTGILALAAAGLGCRRVLAVDYNHLAVRTARDNVRRNDFEDRILAVQARGETLMDTPADLLTANVHYDVMKEMIREPGFCQRPWSILSGLLRTEARQISEQLSELPVRVVENISSDGVWQTLVVRGSDRLH